MSEESLTAVQYGVGPIGARLVRAARNRGMSFVGAIDIDPDKIGRDLGDVCRLDDDLGVTITDDVDTALSQEPDIVFHSTVSEATIAVEQLVSILEAGCNIVSTCEELAFPWYHHPDVGARLDEVADSNGVTCLATGINPGFVMDAMPAYLATPMERIEAIDVLRIQNAGDRREPLQRKVGAGMTPERFETEVATEAGHVGSVESVAMLAHALGWELDEITETIDAVIADRPIETEFLTVETGDVAGVHQVAKGYVGTKECVRLELKMAVGLESRDVVRFDGEPNVSVTVENGYHGDIATSAIVANCAPTVVAADSGMVTMIDLSVPGFVRG